MSEGLRHFLVSASRGGGRNFRSIGDLPTADGARVSPGLVFRSGYPGELTENLRAEVSGLGLRTVITFQTRQEIDILGDPLVALSSTITWEHIPIGDRWFQSSESFSQMPSLAEFYVKMVHDHLDHWTRFFRILAERDRYSVLYHCTAGRDRTGVATVLLLEALRVPRREIVADYLVSNEAFEENVQDASVLAPLFSMIDEAGGIESLLARGGLGAPEIEALRGHLLVRS